MKLTLKNPQRVGDFVFFPGEVEVSDEVGKQLTAQENDENMEVLAPVPSGGQTPALDGKIATLLDENFNGADAIRAATDDQLLAITGIGPATLKEIRAHYPASSAE